MKIKNIFDKDDFSATQKYKKYFSLLYEKIENLNISDNDFPAFDPIIDKLRKNDVDRIIRYFSKILSQKYCVNCLLLYSDEYKGTKCEIEECKGDVKNFTNIFHKWNDIFDIFYELHRYPTTLLKEFLIKENSLNEKINTINNNIEEIQSNYTSTSSGFFQTNKQTVREEDQVKLNVFKNQREDLKQELFSLMKLQGSIKKMTLIKLLRNSEHANLLFNIRSISNQIEVREAYLERAGDMNEYILSYKNAPTQEIANVLSRYHPYAIVQYGFSKNIVIQIEKDEIKTKKINESYQMTEISNRKFCTECNDFFEDLNVNNICTICGNKLIELEIIYPSRVYIHSEDLLINQSKGDIKKFISPNSLYPLSTSKRKPKKTYSEVFYHLEKKDFIPIFKLILPLGDNENESVELIFGDMTIYSYSDSFGTFYSDNVYDKTHRPFKVCSDCLTIWDQGLNEEKDAKDCCPLNPENHSNPTYIRLINILHTEGIKIIFNTDHNNSNLSHTLAHGLRVALQKIAGVDIREIAEVYDKDSSFYIYDTIPGGNAICESLFKKRHDKFQSLADAIDLIDYQLSDKCENGCPLCLYQFNCFERNDPTTFSKQILCDYLKIVDLTKVTITNCNK